MKDLGKELDNLELQTKELLDKLLELMEVLIQETNEEEK